MNVVEFYKKLQDNESKRNNREHGGWHISIKPDNVTLFYGLDTIFMVTDDCFELYDFRRVPNTDTKEIVKFLNQEPKTWLDRVEI